MATGAQVWSTTAANNNSADSNVNWSEGMAPSAVNNSARAQMASEAMFIKDNSGSLLTTGSTAAYTVTSKQVSTGLVDGYTIAINFHATNDSAATLNVDGLGAKSLQLVSGTNVGGGEFVAGTSHRFRYSSSSTAWVAQGANLLGASAVSSKQIADGAVAYSKIQNVSAGTILGNGSTSAAAPSELTIGTGLVATSNSITAPAFPPTSSFKNLSLKVTGTTSATVAADFVTMATSGSTTFNTLPLAANINFGTSGSADTLDTGSLASNTWYAIYAIATTTSTAAHGLASTSFTTPSMPTGYVYKARVGAMVTTTSTAAAALYGTWQYGRTAQYVLGLAGTSVLTKVSTGTNTGSITVPTFVTVSTTNFIPQTATRAYIKALGTGANDRIIICPSTSYGAAGSTTIPPYFDHLAGAGGGLSSLITPILMESSNLYWANNSASGAFIYCTGWEDNL